MQQLNDSGRHMTFFFAGGGTAGHINPALAVARSLQAQVPDADICFLVTAEGLEKDLVASAGFPGLEIRAAALPHNLVTTYDFLTHNLSGVGTAYRLLKKKQAVAVLGTGGYVSAPLLVAAKLLDIPAILHEQNALPGKTNRFLSRFSRKIALTFPGSEKFFPEQDYTKFVWTGNPIHKAFYEVSQETARTCLGLAPDAFVIVCVGGSLGARSLNRAVEGLVHLPAWKTLIQEHPQINLVLSAGKINKRFLSHPELNQDHIHIYDYLDTSLWLPAADFLVGRASGGFLAESAAAGKASLLIPFPEAADNHQWANGRIFEDQGASVLMSDEDLTSTGLVTAIRQICFESDRLSPMSEAAKRLARPTADQDIAQLLIDCFEEK